MRTTELQSLLEKSIQSPDSDAALESAALAVAKSGPTLADVQTILRFMEDHPAMDFGSPGALVHVIEKLYGAGYEGALTESVLRRPTAHTAWMLNRVINVAKDEAQRRQFISALRGIASNASADDETKERAAGFLARLER